MLNGILKQIDKMCGAPFASRSPSLGHGQ
jgi:hypothetical protein